LAFLWYREQIRHSYPGIILNEPTAQEVTWHDLVHDLVVSNMSERRVYATDPSEEWKQWFSFVKEGDSPVYRVDTGPSPGS
jgi:hypothetical protein